MHKSSQKPADASVGMKRLHWFGRDQLALRLAAYSTRISLRVVNMSIGLLVVIVLLLAISVSIGQYPIPLTEAFLSMVGLGNHLTNLIVQTLRLPRALDAVLVGMAFGMSGELFQSVMRNPLASPDVLGVESGAAATAVFLILTGTTGIVLTGGAILGGVATALVIYLLAYKRAGVSRSRLILIGISFATALYSVTTYLLSRTSTFAAQDAVVWLNGSLSGRDWPDLLPVGLALAGFLPFAVLMKRRLLALQCEDEAARGLGVRVEASRVALLLAGVILAATATASAGPLLFIALVAPQLARRVARTATDVLVPAALIGAVLVGAADLIGRLIILPTGEPVGVVTAILGAPYFLWYLTRSARAGEGG